jgi:hypothetical protein
MPKLCPLLALALLAGSARASDHIDGVATTLDNAADLTDTFAFPSPENPDNLVLIMNVHPMAFSAARFSDAVDYTLRIRQIRDAAKLLPEAAGEQTIRCSFSGGTLLIAPNQHATCVFNLAGGTEQLEFDTRGADFVAGGSARSGSLRVFAGVRSDPWFLDLVKTLKFSSGKALDGSAGRNGLAGANVLSIVVELPKSRLGGPLLAVSAQTVRKR